MHSIPLTTEPSLAYLTHAQKAISIRTLVTQYTVEYRLFTFMITWLTGRCRSLPQPSIMRVWYCDH